MGVAGRPLVRLLAAGLLVVLVVVGLLWGTREAAVEEVPLEVTGPGGVELDVALYRTRGEVDPAPALLLAHGFGSTRTSLSDLAVTWARRGYVAITWSARGFGRSEGRIGLADPAAEIADVSAILDVLAGRPEVALDGPDDPRVAIAGGSYGGGSALLAAIAEPRLDAVAAVAAWHDLPRALAPDLAGGPGVLKTQWVSLLFTAGAVGIAGPDGQAELPSGAAAEEAMAVLAAALAELDDPALLLCGRFTPEICDAYLSLAGRAELDQPAADLLGRANPAGRLTEVTAPTLLVHHLDDSLFGLLESLDNARELSAGDAAVALRWVPGGHAGLGEPGLQADQQVQAWLSRWLPADPDAEVGATDAPARFGWVDEVSGELQEQDALPGPEAAGGLRLAATGLGRLEDADQPATGPDGQLLAHPPGGLPAAISTLPGLESLTQLGRLLGPLDIPGQSLSFATDALDTDLVLLGQPTLQLRLDAHPLDGGRTPSTAVVFAKFYDITPGGTATLLHSTVTPLVLPTGETTAVTLPPLAHRLVAGNRLQLVLATTDQAFASRAEPAVYELATDGTTTVTLPTTQVIVADPLPAAARIAIPLLLVVLAASVAALVVARRERSRAAAAGPTDPDAAVVEIRGLAKRYPDGEVAVDGIDLEVHRGQVMGLLGPNGAGKTTTMRMLLGLITPTHGSVTLLGQQVVAGHPVFHRVGVLVEGPGFAPHLTGRQNLESYWLAGGRPLADANLDRALSVADLGSAIDRPTRTYSHGMRQRLAIAQALLGDPELLVLDEPTDGLDPEQIRTMRHLLAAMGEEGMTILVSSHLLAEVEQMCTHVAVMQQGRLVATGPVAELAGATRSVVIRTDDRRRAAEVLGPLVGAAGRVAAEGDGLVVELDGADPAMLVESLVNAGVRVQSVAPRGRLEDAFLALTGSPPDVTSTPREHADAG